MYENFASFLANKSSLCIIQAENPDGDSLGSAIALDFLLQGKSVSLYFSKNPRSFHASRNTNRASIHFAQRPINQPFTSAHRIVPAFTPSKRPNPKNAKDKATPKPQLMHS